MHDGICHGNSIYPSLMCVLCIKTAKYIIKILSLSDRAIILVFVTKGCCVNLTASPLVGTPNTRGGSDFRPTCSYILVTVIDRGIFTIKNKHKVVCALSNSAAFDDLE